MAPTSGYTQRTLRRWLLKAEQGVGERSGPTSGNAERPAALERENRERKLARHIPRKSSAFFAAEELNRLTV